MKDRYAYLNGFTFDDCLVRSSSIIGFTAQKWPDSDPLEQRHTAVFFYYPKKPKERQWAVVSVGHATGIHGCAVTSPAERWVFLMDDGEVYVVGKGDNDYEKPIDRKPDMYFSNVKSVRNGWAYAVGPRRKVYVRRNSGGWTQLDAGLFPQGSNTDLRSAGFRDIDGFDDKDIYACGGRGDLWHYDGNVWMNVDVPTNADLQNICCAEDGLVYITTGTNGILRGRDATWELIEQDVSDDILEAIVDFNGKVIVSTIPELYYLDGDELKVFEPKKPKMNSRAHLAAGDGVLVVAGDDEATMYDGKSWSVILDPVP